MSSQAEAPPFTNRLAREKSPYLLQHASNPVDWHPWGELAFSIARKENKPIFLSIGYSTCHWCHVMEKESFENSEVARLLNEHFVSIKVDREERPDVDAVYMSYVQAATGSGGWPMSVWLTPALKPFFGGTYFPPDDKDGRPGFMTLLERIAEAWNKERKQLENSADSAVAQLQSALGRLRLGSDVEPSGLLVNAFEKIVETYDPVNGGFGGAPKFPRPAVLHFLFRHHAISGGKEALAMGLHTLRCMANGGINDRIGGGFHRYAVDENWHVPHFEKMLYDQAQLASAALDAFRLMKDPVYSGMASDILEYVRRDLTGPEGQFYSAEDADSPDPQKPGAKAEGAFYVWDAEEIKAFLGEKAAKIFSSHYGVRQSGNVKGQGVKELWGKNVLHVAKTMEETAREFAMTPEDARRVLEQCRARLLEARSKRPRPSLDDKTLTAWNGLMISAFARGAQVLASADYADLAGRAVAFVRTRLLKGTDRLWRRYRDGEAAVEGMCADYAFLVQGLLDLYEAEFDVGMLELAVTLQDSQDAQFWDTEQGGYFDSTPDPRILFRLKEAYDGAEPSANSISAMNLLRLHHFAPEKGYNQKVDALFKAFSRTLQQLPDSAPQLFSALEIRKKGIRQIVVAGKRENSDTQALLAVIRREFIPDAIVILADDAGRSRLEGKIPELKGMSMLDGKATVYMCRNYTCMKPVSDPHELARQLKSG